MRTLLIAIVFAVLMGINPLGAANTVSRPCTLTTKAPALVKDAAKAVKINYQDVVLVEDFSTLFTCLGLKAPAGVEEKRAFVLGHSLPVYLNYDWEVKGLVKEYEKNGDKFFKIFVASWLAHELVHVGGEDKESSALQSEYEFLRKGGMTEDDPNILKLSARIKEAKSLEARGKTQVVQVALAPPPRQPVEPPLPEAAPRPATLVAAR